MRTTLVCAALAALLPACGADTESSCVGTDAITPICGFLPPEDIDVVPGGEALVVGGFSLDNENGDLRVLQLADHRITPVFPPDTTPAAAIVREPWGDPNCPGPPTDGFAAHGIQPGDKLYFVNLLEHKNGKVVEGSVSLGAVLRETYKAELEVEDGVAQRWVDGDPVVGKFLELRVHAYGGVDLSMDPVAYEPGGLKMVPLVIDRDDPVQMAGLGDARGNPQELRDGVGDAVEQRAPADDRAPGVDQVGRDLGRGLLQDLADGLADLAHRVSQGLADLERGDRGPARQAGDRDGSWGG